LNNCIVYFSFLAYVLSLYYLPIGIHDNIQTDIICDISELKKSSTVIIIINFALAFVIYFFASGVVNGVKKNVSTVKMVSSSNYNIHEF